VETDVKGIYLSPGCGLAAAWRLNLMAKGVKAAGEAAVECVLRVMGRKDERAGARIRIEIEMDREAAVALAAQIVRSTQ
jgi:hypothetical protein